VSATLQPGGGARQIGTEYRMAAKVMTTSVPQTISLMVSMTLLRFNMLRILQRFSA
jgi:hypothetical protein